MTLYRRLQQRLTQTVTKHPFNGTNAFGDESYSTAAAVTYRARVEGLDVETVQVDGREVVARGRVIIGPTSTGGTPSLDLKDKLILPDNTSPPVLSVSPKRWRSGTIDHLEVIHG